MALVRLKKAITFLLFFALLNISFGLNELIKIKLNESSNQFLINLSEKGLNINLSQYTAYLNSETPLSNLSFIIDNTNNTYFWFNNTIISPFDTFYLAKEGKSNIQRTLFGEKVNLTIYKGSTLLWKKEYLSQYTNLYCSFEYGNYTYYAGFTDEGDGDGYGRSALVLKVDKKTGSIVSVLKYEPIDGVVNDDFDGIYGCVGINGKLYLVGNTFSSGKETGYISVIDLTTFTKLYETTYSYIPETGNTFFSIDTDGKYLYVYGYATTSPSTVYIIKFDLSWNVLAVYSIDNPSDNFGCREGTVESSISSVSMLKYYNKSVYAIIRYRCIGDWGGDGYYDDYDVRSVILKLDNNLNLKSYAVADMFTSYWEGYQDEIFTGIDATDRGVFVTGYYVINKQGLSKGFIIKYDHNLNKKKYISWNSFYGEEYSTTAFKIKEYKNTVLVFGYDYSESVIHPFMRVFDTNLNLIQTVVLDNSDQSYFFEMGNFDVDEKEDVVYVGGRGSNSQGVIYAVKLNYLTKQYDSIAFINITNPNTYDLTNYQLRINISNITQKTIYNFLIVDQDNNLVPYCFEQANGECNQTPSDVIWVKVSYIPANGYVTLKVLKDSINNAVNGEQIFDFYDDFSKVSLDTSKWVIEGSPTISISNSILSISGPESWGNDIKSIKTFTLPLIIESKVEYKDDVTNTWQKVVYYQSQSYAVGVYNDQFAYPFAMGGYFGFGPTVGKSYIYHIVQFSDYVYTKIFEFPFTLLGSKTSSSLTSAYGSTASNYQPIKIDAWGNNYIDWIRVRKYADKEPTYTIQKSKVTDLNQLLPYKKDFNFTEYKLYLKDITTNYPLSSYFNSQNLTFLFDTLEQNLVAEKKVVINETIYNQTTFDLSTFTEGNYSVDYGKVTKNIDGFTLEDVFNISNWFVVDHSPPIITYNLKAPKEGFYAQQQKYNITITANDNFKLNQCQITINDYILTKDFAEPLYNYTFDKEDYITEEPVIIYVECKDAAGNKNNLTLKDATEGLRQRPLNFYYTFTQLKHPLTDTDKAEITKEILGFKVDLFKNDKLTNISIDMVNGTNIYDTIWFVYKNDDQYKINYLIKEGKYTNLIVTPVSFIPLTNKPFNLAIPIYTQDSNTNLTDYGKLYSLTLYLLDGQIVEVDSLDGSVMYYFVNSKDIMSQTVVNGRYYKTITLYLPVGYYTITTYDNGNIYSETLFKKPDNDQYYITKTLTDSTIYNITLKLAPNLFDTNISYNNTNIIYDKVENVNYKFGIALLKNEFNESSATTDFKLYYHFKINNENLSIKSVDLKIYSNPLVIYSLSKDFSSTNESVKSIDGYLNFTVPLRFPVVNYFLDVKLSNGKHIILEKTLFNTGIINMVPKIFIYIVGSGILILITTLIITRMNVPGLIISLILWFMFLKWLGAPASVIVMVITAILLAVLLMILV